MGELNKIRETGATEAPSPVLAIPVMAEDVARAKRRRITAIVVVTAIVLLAGLYLYERSTEPFRAREANEVAERLLASGRYDQAIVGFDRVISLKSDYFDAYLGRGMAWAYSDHLDNALRDLTRAVELRPTSSVAFLDRAQVYRGLKNYQASLNDATRAINIDPEFARAYLVRGMIVRAAGDPARALEDFNRAVEIAPSMDDLFQRGSVYALLGRHREAVADFDRVLEIDPEDAQIYYARSASRQALGDTQGASEDHRMGRILDGR